MPFGEQSDLVDIGQTHFNPLEAVDFDEKDSPLMAALKQKGLPDQETKEPLEGLLYFPIEGKIKPKDVAVIYKGPAGKLVIEFQNPKGGR